MGTGAIPTRPLEKLNFSLLQPFTGISGIDECIAIWHAYCRDYEFRIEYWKSLSSADWTSIAIKRPGGGKGTSLVFKYQGAILSCQSTNLRGHSDGRVGQCETGQYALGNNGLYPHATGWFQCTFPIAFEWWIKIFFSPNHSSESGLFEMRWGAARAHLVWATTQTHSAVSLQRRHTGYCQVVISL